jgi:hypothetical protein
LSGCNCIGGEFSIMFVVTVCEQLLDAVLPPVLLFFAGDLRPCQLHTVRRAAPTALQHLRIAQLAPQRLALRVATLVISIPSHSMFNTAFDSRTKPETSSKSIRLFDRRTNGHRQMSVAVMIAGAEDTSSGGASCSEESGLELLQRSTSHRAFAHLH